MVSEENIRCRNLINWLIDILMALLILQLQALITGGRIGGIKGMSQGSVAPSPSPLPALLASLADLFSPYSPLRNLVPAYKFYLSPFDVFSSFQKFLFLK